MKEELKPILKNYLKIIKSRKELDDSAFCFKRNIGHLLNDEIRSTCQYFENDINGLYNWLLNNKWGLKEKDLSLEDKCLKILQYWSDLSVHPATNTFPKLKDYIQGVYEQKSASYPSIEPINHEEMEQFPKLLVNALKGNNNHFFTDFNNQLKTEPILSNKPKTASEALVTILTAGMEPRRLESYFFIFDQKPDVKDFGELENSGIKYVLLGRNLSNSDLISSHSFAEYNVEMPVELKDFLKQRFGIENKSSMPLFFAIYLSVCDKEGTFFKPENYDVEEIKETYKSLSD